VGAAEREALILINLGEVEFCLGDIKTAAVRGLAAVGRFRALGEKADLGWALVNLTNYQLLQDQVEEARQAATEALSLVQDVGGYILRACLLQWSLLAAIIGKLEEAARLIGFVDSGFREAGETLEKAEQEIHARLLARLEETIPREKRSRFADEGASWTESDAVKRVEALYLSL
jgi:hypothetical protein